jgi:hypothetical protein
VGAQPSTARRSSGPPLFGLSRCGGGANDSNDVMSNLANRMDGNVKTAID